MGRLFASASSQYGEAVTTILSGPPFTLSCWYNATNFASAGFCLGVSSGVTSRAMLGFTNTGNAQFSCVDSSATAATPNTTTTATAGTWCNPVAVCTSASSRDVYLDGLGVGNNTTAITLSGLDRYVIGCRYSASSRGLFANGIIAEAAIWNVALGAQEIAALAKGISPKLIRPSALVFYAPLIGEASPEPNQIGTAVTLGASPTAAAHPRIFRAGRSLEVFM